MTSPDVLLIDDHPLVSMGIQSALDGLGVTAEISFIDSYERVNENIRTASARVVVLDWDLEGLGTSESLISASRDVGSRVVMLTGVTDPSVGGRCLELGAEAVVSKNEPLDDITNAILAVLAGEPLRQASRARLLEALDRQRTEVRDRLGAFEALSPREQVVLSALMHGRSTLEISEREFVSLDTVRSQIKTALRKLGVRSQTEAVGLAYRCGWSPVPDPAAC